MNKEQQRKSFKQAQRSVTSLRPGSADTTLFLSHADFLACVSGTGQGELVSHNSIPLFFSPLYANALLNITFHYSLHPCPSTTFGSVLSRLCAGLSSLGKGILYTPAWVSWQGRTSRAPPPSRSSRGSGCCGGAALGHRSESRRTRAPFARWDKAGLRRA